jgi:uncharacterized membrane protein
MTLLVLDIKLPDGVRFSSNQDAFTHFASVGEAIGTYVVSFFVLAMFWVGHNYQFRYVERLDRAQLWINFLFLLMTTTIPFTTNLVANHSDLSFIASLYAANILLLSGLLLLHAWRLRKHRDLASREFTDAVADGALSRVGLICGVAVIAIVVAQFSPQWGIRMFLLLAALHFVPHLATDEE